MSDLTISNKVPNKIFTTLKKVLLAVLVSCVLATLAMAVGVWAALNNSSSSENLMTPTQKILSWCFAVMSFIQFLMLCTYSLYETHRGISTAKKILLGFILLMSVFTMTGGILLTLTIIQRHTKYLNIIKASLIITYILLVFVLLYYVNNHV